MIERTQLLSKHDMLLIQQAAKSHAITSLYSTFVAKRRTNWWTQTFKVVIHLAFCYDEESVPTPEFHEPIKIAGLRVRFEQLVQCKLRYKRVAESMCDLRHHVGTGQTDGDNNGKPPWLG